MKGMVTIHKFQITSKQIVYIIMTISTLLGGIYYIQSEDDWLSLVGIGLIFVCFGFLGGLTGVVFLKLPSMGGTKYQTGFITLCGTFLTVLGIIGKYQHYIGVSSYQLDSALKWYLYIFCGVVSIGFGVGIIRWFKG